MYDFTSKVTLAAYALQNDNRIRLYKKANEKHRLDLNNIDKNNIEMVNELLDILDDKKASAVTRDHIIALYDFCRENNNNMDDFEKMIHALKEKAIFL